MLWSSGCSLFLQLGISSESSKTGAWDKPRGVSGMNRKTSSSEEVVTLQVSRSLETCSNTSSFPVPWTVGASSSDCADLCLPVLPVICKGNKGAFIPKPFQSCPSLLTQGSRNQRKPIDSNCKSPRVQCWVEWLTAGNLPHTQSIRLEHPKRKNPGFRETTCFLPLMSLPPVYCTKNVDLG